MPGPNELGEFLRARRARLRPAEVGLPAGSGARRTPGLRREEVAALAGLSIDYYIRLEQGRESNPGGPILDGLARALRLNEEEHAHLYALANHAAGRTARDSAPASRVVRPGVRQLLETVRPCPAYVLTRTSDLLAANPEAIALFPGLADWPPERRNTIRYTFLHPAARELFVTWEHSAETIAAHLRSLAADVPGDPEVAALIAELLEGSPDFARFWERHDVRQRRGEAKRFRHPQVGEFTLTYEVLYLADGQRVSIYQAEPGSRDQDALALLSMIASGSAPERHPLAVREAGGQADLLPGIDVGAEFLHGVTELGERVGAEDEQPRRVRILDGGDDGLGGPGRVAGLAAVAGGVLLPPGAHGRGVVADRLAGLGERAQEAGAERTRLDGHDPDPERDDLLAQRLGHGFQRGLAGRVVAGPDGGTARPDRGDADDRAAALRPHAGQDGLNQRARPEEVGREQLLDLIVGGLLDGGAVAVAGVVHEHVDGAEALPGGPHDGAYLGVVGDVQRERERGAGAGPGEILDRGGVARCHHDVLAAVQDGRGKRSPQAGRAAGNEPGGHADLPFVSW
jgi:transcriptional regulator with XRE-family HTH domain